LGKVENCQVGVFLGYTHGASRTLIDRRLYLPEAWATDLDRRTNAGVPEEVTFQTKAQLGLDMLKAALRRGVPFGWVGMDCHYGQQPWLLQELASLSVIYVADIPCDTRVWLTRPATEIPPRQGTRGRLSAREHVKAGEPEPVEVRHLVEQLPEAAWQRLFLRDTERKPLWCRVAVLRVWPVWDELPGPEHWLVIRQNEGESELKYQLSNAPVSTSLARLGQMSASRYWMERALEDAKGEAGLADYEVRGWRGWHHHMTLTLLAMLFLLRLTLKWQGKAPQLTVQDVREILEVILPKRQITPQEILDLIERKHQARDSAKRSHHRMYHLRM
jgi:SRSO17 transposase